MSQVSVTIDGKAYRMACDEGQENHLIELAQKLDGYVGHLKGSFGEIGDQRLTIMAGIMVVDELSELQKKCRSLEEENRELRATGEASLQAVNANETLLLKGLEEAAARIDQLAQKLGSLA